MDTPPLPRRKTIRLQNYDYSQNGTYFVTICTAHKRPLFGVVRRGGTPGPPALPKIINAFKSLTTRKAGCSLWQRGYYEHILRNQQDFDEAAGYIAGNPFRRLERGGFL